MTLMPRAMAGTAALGAAVLVLVAAALPLPARRLTSPAWRPDGSPVRGAFHVHTRRSDGTGTVDQVAAAAARAGLQFVVFTDHGDATRSPMRPAYRSGVLCLDGVEISTSGGHYVALGLGAAPYPLGGAPEDVVEDVARLGGFGVAAHPDSPKDNLAWQAWEQPFDALEWLNADSEWRDEGKARLALALLTYPIRGRESVAALFDRPNTLQRWDEVAKGRRVLAVAGADAHARLAWGAESDPYEGGTAIEAPSYATSLGAFSLAVVLDQPLSHRADEDAARLLAAVRAGHFHSVIDAFAEPGAFEFTARAGAQAVREGDVLAPGQDVVVFRARSNAPAGSRLILLRDGREVSRVGAGELVYATNRVGAYRVEAWLPGRSDRPMPWAVSNPIFVGPRFTAPPRPGSEPSPVSLASLEAGQGAHVEHDTQSRASSGFEGDGAWLQYELGQGSGRSQFVALAYDRQLSDAAAGLAFRGVAGGPMRVSVQVRVPNAADGERWTRSVYLDSTPRDITVRFERMRPAGTTASAKPRPAHVRSLLFVVDRTHAKAGSRGRFSVSGLRAIAPAR